MTFIHSKFNERFVMQLNHIMDVVVCVFQILSYSLRVKDTKPKLNKGRI